MTTAEPAQAFGTPPDSQARMPVLFVGHGSPMNAAEDNEFSRAWIEAGRSLPTPRAILCISAHWETSGTQVTAMEQPETIYDFYGFPEPLYAMHYSAPGSPDLARLVRETVRSAPVRLSYDWGLDHGAWSVLRRFFPQAGVPVVQLSLDRTRPAAFHYELGRELRTLRDKGVLIVGSGNIVHNLRAVVWEDRAYDWALEFDDKIKQAILSGDHAPIIHYGQLGQAARLSVPTNEHYLPLLYALAVQDPADPVTFFAGRVTLGSISMRSLRLG
jgi:4,5-DOPA dioxygenase extradiol